MHIRTLHAPLIVFAVICASLGDPSVSHAIDERDHLEVEYPRFDDLRVSASSRAVRLRSEPVLWCSLPSDPVAALSAKIPEVPVSRLDSLVTSIVNSGEMDADVYLRYIDWEGRSQGEVHMKVPSQGSREFRITFGGSKSDPSENYVATQIRVEYPADEVAESHAHLVVSQRLIRQDGLGGSQGSDAGTVQCDESACFLAKDPSIETPDEAFPDNQFPGEAGGPGGHGPFDD